MRVWARFLNGITLWWRGLGEPGADFFGIFDGADDGEGDVGGIDDVGGDALDFFWGDGEELAFGFFGAENALVGEEAFTHPDDLVGGGFQAHESLADGIIAGFFEFGDAGGFLADIG